MEVGEWHGLAVSIEACHSKGRGIKSRSFLFLLFTPKPESRRGVRHKKKRKSTKGTRNEERWRARERRIEEERSAGVSGLVTRKAFGSSRKRLNG